MLFNDGAGHGVSIDAVQRALEAAGHRVATIVDAAGGRLHTLPGGGELVVVAGGDGTVAKAAVALAGKGVPLALLPCGTANNVAGTLGIAGTTEDLIAGWPRWCRTPLNLGCGKGRFGERRFIESAGAGLVAAGIAAMDADAPHPEKGIEVLRKARRRFRSLLAHFEPQPCRLTIDGEVIEREVLLVEVLNIGRIGPRLLLRPAIDVSDGLLEVVVVGVQHRAELARCLEHDEPLRLPTRSASTVAVAGCDRVHLDDWTDVPLAGGPLHLSIERAVVEVLVPCRAR